MLDQVGHQVHRLTAHESPTIMIEGAEDHLDRDAFEGFVEALRHLLTDVEEDQVEEEGGIELELNAVSGGFPEVGEIKHAFSDQEGIVDPPAPPIQLTDVARGELDRIKDVSQIAIPLPAPQH